MCRHFWTALKQFAGRLPFVEDWQRLTTARSIRRPYARARYPTRSARRLHRPMALSISDLALASRPCVTDDAAVPVALFGLSSHITPAHRAAAAKALGKKMRKI